MLLFSQKHAFYFSILRIKEGLSHVQQPLLRRKVDHNGLVVCISTDAIKRKEPIIRVPAGCGLSALRLCVCSLITVILNCFTWIKVSCLHFGQNSGKFLSSVSFRIFNLVLFPQTGHNIQFSLSIFYYSPLILLLTIRGSELLQLLRLRTLHSRLYLQDNHWHTVLLFPL